MSRTIEQYDPILISKEAFDKIMGWSQSVTEIVFIAVGRGLEITDAFRLANRAKDPLNWFEFDRNESRRICSEAHALGLDVVCFGHSHPGVGHLRRPSMSDFKYLPKNSIQMIVFPNEVMIRAWRFKQRYCETLKAEIKVASREGGLACVGVKSSTF